MRRDTKILDTAYPMLQWLYGQFQYYWNMRISDNLREKRWKSADQRTVVYQDLFSGNIRVMREHLVSEDIIRMLQSQRDALFCELSKPSRFYGQRRMRFVPVIPREYLGFYGLMSLLLPEPSFRNRFMVTVDHLSQIVNTEPTPSHPYFITDIDPDDIPNEYIPLDGRVKNIRGEGRFCLTLEEVVSVCLFHSPMLADKRIVFAEGSHYSSYLRDEHGRRPDFHLNVRLDPKAGPTLSHTNGFIVPEIYSVPSCGARIGIHG